ncbi:MAG: site-specific DNA-methyltransferase [Terriglobales bacterium]
MDRVISSKYEPTAAASLFLGDRLELLAQIPPGSAKLIVTSPPYNIGKNYEKKVSLTKYLQCQTDTLRYAYNALSWRGSLCWQVGNHIQDGEIFPLDTLLYPICKDLGLKLRNRIVWHFEHGLHCSRRFSGRYETILWFTKSDSYTFNLDPVRVPQKYPGKKAFKGPRLGQYTCNPLGKNPGDVWVIPNVKHNHIEKTVHPCQFPIELVERLVLALTDKDDLVVDPYLGVGSAACAAVLHERRAAGSEIVKEYLTIARQRVQAALECRLPRRPIDRPVYKPDPRTKIARRPVELDYLLLPMDPPDSPE